MHTLRSNHPVALFFVLAYVYSWSIALPLAFQAQGIVPAHLPYWLHYFTAFGPALAAVTLSRSRPRFKSRSAWALFAAASPLALFACGRLAATLIGAPYPSWTDLGLVNFLPELGVWSWLLWFVTSGLGEELGWRGYALPHLQRTHSALGSSFVIGLVWAGWHVPAFFYVPSYQGMGLAVAPGFVLGVMSGALVLTWL